MKINITGKYARAFGNMAVAPPRTNPDVSRADQAGGAEQFVETHTAALGVELVLRARGVRVEAAR